MQRKLHKNRSKLTQFVAFCQQSIYSIKSYVMNVVLYIFGTIETGLFMGCCKIFFVLSLFHYDGKVLSLSRTWIDMPLYKTQWIMFLLQQVSISWEKLKLKIGSDKCLSKSTNFQTFIWSFLRHLWLKKLQVTMSDMQTMSLWIFEGFRKSR